MKSISTPCQPLGFERRGIRPAPGGRRPGAGWQTRPCPCAAPAGPVPGAPARWGYPISARPPRPAAPHQRPCRLPALHRSAPCRTGRSSSRRSAIRWYWTVCPPRATTVSSTRTAAAITSGPMPSPGRRTMLYEVNVFPHVKIWIQVRASSRRSTVPLSHVRRRKSGDCWPVFRPSRPGWRCLSRCRFHRSPMRSGHNRRRLSAPARRPR